MVHGHGCGIADGKGKCHNKTQLLCTVVPTMNCCITGFFANRFAVVLGPPAVCVYSSFRNMFTTNGKRRNFWKGAVCVLYLYYM